MSGEDPAATVERVLGELIDAQRAKVLGLARRIDPRITEDDMLNPHDVPALAENAAWNYEDGVLGGYLAAQMALRRALRR